MPVATRREHGFPAFLAMARAGEAWGAPGEHSFLTKWTGFVRKERWAVEKESSFPTFPGSRPSRRRRFGVAAAKGGLDGGLLGQEGFLGGFGEVAFLAAEAGLAGYLFQGG